MELKKPLTFEEQLERLITHGVVVEDKDKALRILSEVNYYRLSGYALEYRKSPHDSDFIEDTTFERIYDLYVIDEEIRNVFRRYIEKIEVYCRTQIAYGFSIKRCLNPLHDQHYDSNNFYNKKGYQEVMEHFSKEKNYYNDTMVMKHHKLTYNNKMPLWVMVELMSLADISKLYSCMYTSEQKTIADNIEDKMGEDGVFPTHKEGYADARWILLDYGDVVAHIFLEEERNFYNLEQLWADAPSEAFVENEA